MRVHALQWSGYRWNCANRIYLAHSVYTRRWSRSIEYSYLYNLVNSSITPCIRHVLPHCLLARVTRHDPLPNAEVRPTSIQSCENLLTTATAQWSPMSPSARNKPHWRTKVHKLCTHSNWRQVDYVDWLCLRDWPRQFEETLSLWICFHSQPPLPASCERLHHKHQDPRWSIQRGKVGSAVGLHSLDLLERGKQCWAPDRSIRPQHIKPSRPWMESALKLRFDPRLQRPKEWSPPSWLCEQLPPDRWQHEPQCPRSEEWPTPRTRQRRSYATWKLLNSDANLTVVFGAIEAKWQLMIMSIGRYTYSETRNINEQNLVYSVCPYAPHWPVHMYLPLKECCNDCLLIN